MLQNTDAAACNTDAAAEGTSLYWSMSTGAVCRISSTRKGNEICVHETTLELVGVEKIVHPFFESWKNNSENYKNNETKSFVPL